MFTAFDTALSALQANSSAIDVIGNNLANLNTTGYKSVEVQFSDLMSQTMGNSLNPAQIGLGLAPINTFRQFTQGTIQTTNGPTDAAISGNGFFVVKNANNQTLYTRAGSFQVDASGDLVTPTGEKVQGWNALGGMVDTSGAVGNLTVPLGATIAAKPTDTMSMAVNLSASAPVATTPPTPGDGSTFSAPVQVYDSLGTAHTLTVTYTHTAANAWSYTVTIPAKDTGGTGDPVQVGSGNLTFNADGTLATPTSDPQTVSVKGLADKASDLSINWNLYGSNGKATITQYDQPSGVSSTTQDGTAAGQISGVSIQNGGLLVASYTNGQQSTIGQIAVANITDPETLVAVGNNDLQASAATAQPSIGTANAAGRGQIIGGAVENSTVDMAAQFTDLLTVERSYQANSRVITTSDQLLQETVNLIHP